MKLLPRQTATVSVRFIFGFDDLYDEVMVEKAIEAGCTWGDAREFLNRQSQPEKEAGKVSQRVGDEVPKRGGQSMYDERDDGK